MKRTHEDEKLASLLKQGGHQAEENEWFTPRVVNRLPEKSRSLHWLRLALCIVAIVAVAGCWVWYLASVNTSIVTVRDIMYFVAMVAGSITIVSAVVWEVVRAD